MSTIIEVKERPILFSAEMIRALLDGRKTQTRRVVKPRPTHQAILANDGKWYDADCINPGKEMTCRFGNVGDHLWVKETWRAGTEWDDDKPSEIEPVEWHEGRADVLYEATPDSKDAPAEMGWGKLRPSLFMPRWASRITLEITGVRVERLQDISEADAIAEGVTFEIPAGAIPDNIQYPKDMEKWTAERRETWFLGAARSTYMAQCVGASNAIEAFKTLWESINGKGAWAANPWLWVVEFKRLESK